MIPRQSLPGPGIRVRDATIETAFCLDVEYVAQPSAEFTEHASNGTAIAFGLHVRVTTSATAVPTQQSRATQS
jgi:hypothetical protein